MSKKKGIDELITANNMLGGIKALSIKHDALVEKHSKRAQEIEAEFIKECAPLKDQLVELGKQLKAYSKKEKEVLFGGRVSIVLGNGSLFHLIQKPVVQARGVLKKLEELKKDHLIKISKNVDWDRVGKLSDDDLKEIGTRRKRKESFDYEVK